MRNALRSLSIGLFAIGLVTCADLTSRTHPGGLARATFSLAPHFSATASSTAAALAQLGLDYDQVRIVIVRPETDTLKDTTVTFHSGDAPLTLELSVLAVPDEHLGATIQFKSGATVLFQGSSNVTATPANATGTATNSVSIAVTYVGPGATATKIALAPGSGTYASGIVTQFTAKAFDANNVELLNVPIGWSVSNASIATINAAGALTPKATRGTVTVTAALGTLSQSATVNLVPPGTGLRIVQGAAQSGSPGSQLPLPVIVELIGADGLPGLGTGLTATFAANGGGSVTPGSVAFSAEGRAQALFTLGASAGGIYLYTVTAGSFSVIVPEIAVVGPPTQLIPSGATTLTITSGVVPNPLPTFRVADALGNSVPSVPLTATFAKQGATGTTSVTFLADTIGLGSVATLVSTISVTASTTVTLTISSANPAVSFPSLTYTITILPHPAPNPGIDELPANVSANPVTSPAGVLPSALHEVSPSRSASRSR